MAKQMDLNLKVVNSSDGANLGFEQKTWQAADKLRNNMDTAEYKHVVLGLIFLKYISDGYFEVYNELKSDPAKAGGP
jgi:type I restriction enzyme M protein